jgi:hypothetical protein
MSRARPRQRRPRDRFRARGQCLADGGARAPMMSAARMRLGATGARQRRAALPLLLRRVSPNSATARQRSSVTTRGSGRTSTRRSGSARRSRSSVFAVALSARCRPQRPGRRGAGALHQGAVFRGCSAIGRLRCGPRTRAPATSGHFVRALCRTRTGDPFLTVVSRGRHCAASASTIDANVPANR